ncbi:MAG: bifunctional 5,10-methylenetetrahydrofolate dehydrogenase/5,10-methenyltetrahydrofolate cyclohydrolase [Actinomycetota bacterium]|nr:bifunctional 5,10-methylenetetrahydrofolate dehydrogenase/5,10-methenyltetrahydrofolate cyclohydrolase [Actinomycetota bacterium]
MAEAEIVDGRALAARVREGVRGEVAEFLEDTGVTPALATVLVGDDPSSRIYVRRKGEACGEVGMVSVHRELPAEASQEALADVLAELNADAAVHGVLLQLPVPPQIHGDEMTATVDPLKDVDGLHPMNAGLLAQGREGMVPCTPAAVMELLGASRAELRGASAVVLGRSNLVGKPLAALLLARDATVTSCHSRTRDLASICRHADVLIAAVGVPKLVNADMVRQGATVIDVGINRVEEGLVGDVDFEAVREKARAITPVPGGVGPMTIAMLLRNTLAAARRQVGAPV